MGADRDRIFRAAAPEGISTLGPVLVGTSLLTSEGREPHTYCEQYRGNRIRAVARDLRAWFGSVQEGAKPGRPTKCGTHAMRAVVRGFPPTEAREGRRGALSTSGEGTLFPPTNAPRALDQATVARR